MKKSVKKYKVLIFDLDGTLIDTMPIHFQAFKETLKSHGIKIRSSVLRDFMEGSTKYILEEIKKLYNFSGTIEDIREERRYHYFRLLRKKNILFPGVKKLLKELSREYKLAIATGSSRTSVKYSFEKELQKLFFLIVTINDVKRGKPFPDQLKLVFKKLNVKPSECLMIGDTTFDILSAKNAKIDSIGVTTGYNTKKELIDAGAMITLKDIRDIKNYLN